MSCRVEVVYNDHRAQALAKHSVLTGGRWLNRTLLILVYNFEAARRPTRRNTPAQSSFSGLIAA